MRRELENRVQKIPVYQETVLEPVWDILEGEKDDVFIYDRCGHFSYFIPLPLSLLNKPFVRMALLNAYYNSPCGFCNVSSITETNETVITESEIKMTTEMSKTTFTSSEVNTTEIDKRGQERTIHHHHHHHSKFRGYENHYQKRNFTNADDKSNSNITRNETSHRGHKHHFFSHRNHTNHQHHRNQNHTSSHNRNFRNHHNQTSYHRRTEICVYTNKTTGSKIYYRCHHHRINQATNNVTTHLTKTEVNKENSRPKIQLLQRSLDVVLTTSTEENQRITPTERPKIRTHYRHRDVIMRQEKKIVFQQTNNSISRQKRHFYRNSCSSIEDHHCTQEQRKFHFILECCRLMPHNRITSILSDSCYSLNDIDCAQLYRLRECCHRKHQKTIKHSPLIFPSPAACDGFTPSTCLMSQRLGFIRNDCCPNDEHTIEPTVQYPGMCQQFNVPFCSRLSRNGLEHQCCIQLMTNEKSNQGE